MRGKEEKKNPIESQFLTRGHSVVWQNFKDLVKTDEFKSLIESLRKVYKKSLVFDKEINKKRFKNSVVQKKYLLVYKKNVKQFLLKNNLNYTDFTDLIDYFVIHNKMPKPIKYQNAYNLCIVEDKIDRAQKADNKEWRESDDRYYPISIRINPNVGIKMLQDFIKQTFKTHIKPRQKRNSNTKTKIVIPRKRPKHIRDNIVIKNRALELEKVNDLLYGKGFEMLSRSEFNEIIRRKTGAN